MAYMTAKQPHAHRAQPEDFQPMDQAEVAALLVRTAPLAGKGEYELFKTTQ